MTLKLPLVLLLLQPEESAFRHVWRKLRERSMSKVVLITGPVRPSASTNGNVLARVLIRRAAEKVLTLVPHASSAAVRMSRSCRPPNQDVDLAYSIRRAVRKWRNGVEETIVTQGEQSND
jgi:hypothetical protein